MKPESNSKTLLAVTRSRAKMFEYGIPKEYHIAITRDPARLFTFTIGALGEFAALLNSTASDGGELEESCESLTFAAHFFNAFLEAQLDESFDPYVTLLGSASYYLCDLPGCSKILTSRLNNVSVDLEGGGLEILLRRILRDSEQTERYEGAVYSEFLSAIGRQYDLFRANGTGIDSLLGTLDLLRKNVYSCGTPRHLLFADVVCAAIRKKCANSAWAALPLYTDLTAEKWKTAIMRPRFIKELWPAQHLLGSKGILRGKSAVVQLPTSAGKTKATDLILRSAFLSDRTALAVVIAPFRALCHEISDELRGSFANEQVEINELSDVLQDDFPAVVPTAGTQVLVATPEKFLYMLRHSTEIANNIGVAIFDEGHQFDNGSRGITYELLLTSLKSLLPQSCQKVLISAVIANGDKIGEWMNGPSNEVVQGSSLSPTIRTVAFVSWTDMRGRLVFVEQENIEQEQFFVPRVIESIPLERRTRERTARFFPNKADADTVALSLGLQLCSGGGVAVFCGKKQKVKSLVSTLLDAFERKLGVSVPAQHSNEQEVQRLHYLYECHLGEQAIHTRAAHIGVYTHSADTPEGIRLSVEHATRENLICFVICTSTLAQGVNLPIRYLLVTGVRQGEGRIKARDFHNLMGRAGRAGMHTEGSVIFSDHSLYDGRRQPNSSWRWQEVKALLNPINSEPCISNLLSLFKPFESDDGSRIIPMEPLAFVQEYIKGSESFTEYKKVVFQTLVTFRQQQLERQFSMRIDLINSVESFLMSNLDPLSEELFATQADNLAQSTLAYFLADDIEKQQIRDCISLLAARIESQVNSTHKRSVYSKTLFGLNDATLINSWVSENVEKFYALSNVDDLFDIVWELCSTFQKNGVARKLVPEDLVKEAAVRWLRGDSFDNMLQFLDSGGARLTWGNTTHAITIDNLVDLCQNAFGFDTSLVVGAVAEILDLFEFSNRDLAIALLRQLQKCLKYGLPDAHATSLYEICFPDRVVVMEISKVLPADEVENGDLIADMRNRSSDISPLLRKYPTYFESRFQYFVSRP